MVNRWSAGVIVAFMLAWACYAQLPRDVRTDPDVPAHLAAADAIATQILAADNEYAHKNCAIQWKGTNGADKYVNRTDCSDFFNLLIEHAYGFSRAQMKRWTGHERPTAAAWYDAVSSGQAKELLQPIATIDDAAPGNMIFLKYPPGEPNTGHVMLIAAAPESRPPTKPIVEQTKQWAVTVIDSSKSGHGPTDTRHNTDGTSGQGVGKGVLRLYTHPDGTLAGYSWSTLGASKFISVEEHAALIARLTVPKDH